MNKLLLGIAVVTSALSFARSEFPEILDPDGPPNPLLESIASQLHSRGIDVILGRAADFDVDRLRPRIAPLGGFKATPESTLDWNTLHGFNFAFAFEDGLAGAILATKAGEMPPRFAEALTACLEVAHQAVTRACRFIDEWASTPRDRRVFVAFTRDDVDAAAQVVDALRAEGYVAFAYLRTTDQEPWADADLVGEFFEQSGQHLVLDTESARGSVGIEIEQVCVNALRVAPPRSPFRPILEAVREVG